MTHVNEVQTPWLLEGYVVFARQGPHALKVEQLARAVQKNKSSFYHQFVNLEIFQQALLSYHIQRVQVIVEKERASTSLAELIDVILDHKLDLLFSRQLRVHRENPDFTACFEKTNREVGKAIIEVWAQEVGLEGNLLLSDTFLQHSLEHFYFQITEANLNRDWLNAYFQNLREMVGAFLNSGQMRASSGKA